MINRKGQTPSRTSPKNQRRGCLCKNGTYSRKCCNGKMINQGIGSLTGGSSAVINGVTRSSDD
jgi:hypothetical protein